MIKKTFQNMSFLKANIIFLILIFFVFMTNVFQFYDTKLQDIIEILGTFIQIALPCYAIVPILSKKDKKGAKQMLIFLATILTITYILKFTVPEKRPYGGSMSFPSGHTAGAFVGAVFLGIRYGKNYFKVALPLAVFVGFSRIYSHNHWPIDVFTSILFCFLIGYVLVKKYPL